ncbi:hypothetical protein AB0E62_13285 [Streptomyces sp. NPDC038707]|uniref:hypothetical protein n=1 Tax=unclassified Streptomyces TaxID=2593676 RepID=UPI0033DEEB8A
MTGPGQDVGKLRPAGSVAHDHAPCSGHFTDPGNGVAHCALQTARHLAAPTAARHA